MQKIEIINEGIKICSGKKILWEDIVDWRNSKEKIVGFENSSIGKFLFCFSGYGKNNNNIFKKSSDFFILYTREGEEIRLSIMS